MRQRVNQYFKTLESSFEYQNNSHIYLSDAINCLKGDLDSRNTLALEVLESMGDCNPYDENFETYFHECVGLLGMLNATGIMEDAFSIGVASLSYIGFMEGLIDLPIYNIQCNSNEAYIDFLAQGNPVETTQMESVGDITLDFAKLLSRTNLDDSRLERFVRSEYQLVEDQSQGLKALIPWVPLEDHLRINPEQNLLLSVKQVDTILDVNKKIQYDRSTILSELDILDCIAVDKQAVLRSFGNGDYLNNSIAGTYLIFLHGLLRGILTYVISSKIERLPMVKYVRSTMTHLIKTRLDNRYVLLGFMIVNGIVGKLEKDYFNQYDEETKFYADHLFAKYSCVAGTTFDFNCGVEKHGVPDDIYKWMMVCLQTTVLPEATKAAIRDSSIYPAIGPVRLVFESTTEFHSGAAVGEGHTPQGEEQVCESLVKSLIQAVDPSGIESLQMQVESPVGESGATNLTDMLAVMEVLHKDAVNAKVSSRICDIANITAAQKLVVESVNRSGLSGNDSHRVKIMMEATMADIANGTSLVSSYTHIPSFRSTLNMADANASKLIQDILTNVVNK